MKAMIISEEQSVLSKMDSILSENGVDCIQYTWLMKALDNLAEIHPDLIIVNATDYPRHWKTLAQFVRTSFSDIKVILFTPDGFSSDEDKKAEELGISLRCSSFEEFSAKIGACTSMSQIVSPESDEISGGGAEQDYEIPTVENIILSNRTETENRSGNKTDLHSRTEDFVLFTVENVFSSVAEDFVLYTCDSIFDGLYKTESQSDCDAEKTAEKSVSAQNSPNGAQNKNYCGSLLKKIEELHLG